MSPVHFRRGNRCADQQSHYNDQPIPGSCAVASAAGAPPSNTAPSTSIGAGIAETKIVGSGMDSLYLSVPGALKPGIQALLDRLKECAQSHGPETRALAQYPSQDWGTQTNTSIAGIYNNTGVTGLFVVIDSTGQLGVSTAPPAGTAQTAYAPRLGKEMQLQAAQIRDLKQQLEELKGLNQATQVALRKLQAKDKLVAQR